MQTTNAVYDQKAVASMRPVSWRLRASFPKLLDEDVGMFTLNQSLLNGRDLLAPVDRDVIMPWDKYDYSAFDDRVLSLEVTHEEQDPYSLAQAIAEVNLNNVDNLFSPNSGSILADFILPRRPFKIFMGFGDTVFPLFFGLNERMPVNDDNARTSIFRLIDFLSTLYEREIGSTIMLEDVRANEALAYVFEHEFGLSSDQYQLDVGLNTIPLFYIPKGTKFGPVVEQLMEAEMGRIFMNELGVIRFRNRYNYDLTPVMFLNSSNVISATGSTDANVINSVQVNANPRAIQEEQPIYQSLEEYTLASGQSIDIWAPVEDPLKSATQPIYSTSEVSDQGYYISTDSQVVISDFTYFAEAVLITFTNNSMAQQTITDITLWGQPAKPVFREPIKVIEQNEQSVQKYEEKWYPSREGIQNDYIQSASAAQALALFIINDYKEVDAVVELEIRGNPALQLGDAVSLNLSDHSGIFTVTKIVDIIRDGGFIQKIKARRRSQVTFFTLNESLLNGEDVLGL